MNHATKGTVWQLLWRFTLCSVASPSEEMVLTLRHVKQSQLSSAVASSSIPGFVFETATTRRTSFWMDLSSVGRLYWGYKAWKSLSCINIYPTLLQELIRTQRILCCFDAKFFPPTWILKVKYDWNCHVQADPAVQLKVWLYVFAWFCMQTIRNHASMSAPFSTEPLSITTSEVDDDDDLAIKHPSSRAKATQGWKYVA